MRAAAALVAVMAVNVNAASTTSVPIRLHGTEAPVVILRVQGRELPLQLDLGDASSLVLHPEVLATLRSEPTAEMFKGFSMDGNIETPIARLDLVELGDLKIYSVAARQDVHDDAFRNYRKTEVGAVGFVGTDAGELQLGWDTGAPAILMSRSTAIAAHLAAELDSAVSKKFEVGGRDFGPQRIEIWNIPLPTEIAGLVGHPFFHEHVVCFDYRNLTLHIE